MGVDRLHNSIEGGTNKDGAGRGSGGVGGLGGVSEQVVECT